MAFLVAVAAGAGAVAVGLSTVAAVLIGGAAAAIYDYVVDSMMDDISVDTMQGRNVSGKDSIGSRRYIYGTCRVGGTIVYQANSGSDNKYLHTFIVFSDGRNTEFEEIYFDDVKAAGIEQSGGSLKYFNRYSLFEDSNSNQGSKTMIMTRLGYPDQNLNSQSHAGTDLPDQWGVDHDLNGVCHAYVRLEYDETKHINGFPNITAIIKGKTQYDPRQDSTSSVYDSSVGVSTQRIDDETTWQYSENSAVCLLNYMLDTRLGLGESIEAFNLDKLATAMDICDELVTYDGDGNQQARYTCNGIIDSANSHRTNISNILTSMNGQLLYSGGKYVVKAYAYETPSGVIVDEDMIVGSFDVITKNSKRNMYNRVKGRFVSEHDNYIMTEYPVQKFLSDDATPIASFEVADGEIMYHEYNLPMTTNHHRAQRLARLTMLRSRMQATIKFTANSQALQYTVGDNIRVANAALGYSSDDPKIFQIQRLNVKIDADKGLVVQIEAKENAQSIYDWQATDAESFTTGSLVELYEGTLDAPTFINAVTIDGGMYCGWLHPEYRESVEFVLTVSPTDPNYNDTRTYPTKTNVVFVPLNQDISIYKEYNFSVKAVDTATGAQSASISVNRRKVPLTGSRQPIVVTGTAETPTNDDIRNSLADQNIFIGEYRTELVYVRLNDSGFAIDSTPLVYIDSSLHQIQHSPIYAKTASKNPQNFDLLEDRGDIQQTYRWTVIGDESKVIVGSGVVRFENASQNDMAQVSTMRTRPITPERRYKLQYTEISEGNVPYTLLVQAYSFDGHLVTILTRSNSPTQGSSPFTISNEFDVPKNTKELRVLVRGTTQNNTNASFDDFVIHEVTPDSLHNSVFVGNYISDQVSNFSYSYNIDEVSIPNHDSVVTDHTTSGDTSTYRFKYYDGAHKIAQLTIILNQDHLTDDKYDKKNYVILRKYYDADVAELSVANRYTATVTITSEYDEETTGESETITVSQSETVFVDCELTE